MFGTIIVVVGLACGRSPGECTPILDGLTQAETKVTLITAIFFSLVFLCATQDVAVDGITFGSRLSRMGFDVVVRR